MRAQILTPVRRSSLALTMLGFAGIFRGFGWKRTSCGCCWNQNVIAAVRKIQREGYAATKSSSPHGGGLMSDGWWPSVPLCDVKALVLEKP
mmetsp:Transcript_29604/g.114171  ORF Transcript_29604/g.114171 Transcript_29604/m.114171 type:complete len:91 (-) Transcript_29604:178-450(-)